MYEKRLEEPQSGEKTGSKVMGGENIKRHQNTVFHFSLPNSTKNLKFKKCYHWELWLPLHPFTRLLNFNSLRQQIYACCYSNHHTLSATWSMKIALKGKLHNISSALENQIIFTKGKVRYHCASNGCMF